MTAGPAETQRRASVLAGLFRQGSNVSNGSGSKTSTPLLIGAKNRQRMSPMSAFVAFGGAAEERSASSREIPKGSPAAVDSPTGMDTSVARLLGGIFVPLPEGVAKSALNNESYEVLKFVTDLPIADRSERRDDRGRSLVHLAAEVSSPSLLMELVGQASLRFNVVDYGGRTPLHVAAGHGHMEHCTYLVSKGASPRVLDAEGRTPYDVAIESGSHTVAEYFAGLECGDALGEKLRDRRANSMLLDPEGDVHQFWQEVEAVLSLQAATSLIGLPWSELPAEGSVWMTYAPAPVKQVAGMLLMDGSYQFDCMCFAPAIVLTSPYDIQTTCTVYVGLDCQCTVQVFHTTQRPMVFLRCFLSERPVESEEAPPLRTTSAEETERLALLPKSAADALRARSLDQLEGAAAKIRRIYRWGTALEMFRQVMYQLVEQILVVKRFLRNVNRAKHFGFLVCKLEFTDFEKYARTELAKLDTSQFPVIARALKSSNYQRESIIFTAVQRRKKYFRDQYDRGVVTKFRYKVDLIQILEVYVEQLEINELALALQTKASFLPRSTLVALARHSHSMNAEQVARQRILAVLGDMIPLFHKKRSYAEEFLSMAIPENFLSDTLEEVRKQSAKPVRKLRFSSALYQQPKRFQVAKSVRPRRAVAGAEEMGNHHDEDGLSSGETAVVIDGRVSFAVSPPARKGGTGVSSAARRGLSLNERSRRETLSYDEKEGGRLLGEHLFPPSSPTSGKTLGGPPGSGRRNVVCDSGENSSALQWTHASPIPRLVGSSAALRRMLTVGGMASSPPQFVGTTAPTSAMGGCESDDDSLQSY